ncbi:hypothetical protein D3C72_1273170 [compost metagenome]
MGFLVLGHVDGDDVTLAAVQGVGQRQCGFGLANAARAEQQEHTDRLVRVFHACAGNLDALADFEQCMVLAEYPLAQQCRQALHGFDFVAQHFAQRNTGPAGNHFADGAAIYQCMHQRLFTLDADQLGAHRGNFLSIWGLVFRVAEGAKFFHQLQFTLPLLFKGITGLLFAEQFGIEGGQAAGMVAAFGGFLLQHRDLCLQVVDLALAVFQRSRLRRLPQGDPGASGVQHADGFVRQLAPGDVAIGQAHGLHQRFVHHRDLVMFLHFGQQAAQHVDRLVFVRLFDLHHLEAAGEGGIFLEVLLVLGPGGRRDSAQLATSKRGLE